MVYDVIIIGSGPAGLTAAIYSSRANLNTLVLAGELWGGELMNTTEVENFPGFPEGILGPDLMFLMRKQAEKYGAEILQVNFSSADYSKRPFNVKAGDKIYETKSVIIVTGATHSPLDVPGEKEFSGKGVSYCAICDAAFFRNKKVAVVGGGDTAMTDAIFLAKFAESVTVVHRRDQLRASQIMQERARQEQKINFILNTEVLEVMGDQKVTGLKIKNVKSGEVKELPIDGVFAAVGYKPQSELFPEIEKDERGYIIQKENTMTSIEGVFVAGDVFDKRYKQAVTAAGFGCMAALDAEQWLSSRKEITPRPHELY